MMEESGDLYCGLSCRHGMTWVRVQSVTASRKPKKPNKNYPQSHFSTIRAIRRRNPDHGRIKLRLSHPSPPIYDHVTFILDQSRLNKMGMNFKILFSFSDTRRVSSLHNVSLALECLQPIVSASHRDGQEASTWLTAQYQILISMLNSSNVCSSVCRQKKKRTWKWRDPELKPCALRLHLSYFCREYGVNKLL